MKSENVLIGLIGVGASGKTDIAKYIVEKHHFLYIPAITSRPPRPGHQDGYIHITKEEFEKYINDDEVLEYTIFNGNYYGKLKKIFYEQLKKDKCVCTLTTDRAEELKRIYDKTIIILIQPQEPVLETVEKRMHGRAVHHPDEVRSKLQTVVEELEIIKDLQGKEIIDYTVTTVDSDHSLALKEIDEIIDTL